MVSQRVLTVCGPLPQNGTADAATMSADDVYTAGWCHGLELAAGESYNGEGEFPHPWEALVRWCCRV